MSQKKVDAYKKEKANRDKIMKREKRILLIEKLVGLVICLAAVCWIGYSVYAKVTQNQEVVVKDTVMDTSALDEYVSGLTAEDTEEDAEAVADAEEDAETVTDTEVDAEAAGTDETAVTDAEAADTEEAEDAAAETDAAADTDDTADAEEPADAGTADEN